MRAALEEAQKAREAGEVPVGAVIVRGGEVLVRAFNRTLTTQDPTAHAEIVGLREAARLIGNHRLTGCEMYVTLEPCAMCAGALIQARLDRLIYGAADPKAGAVVSVVPVLNHPKLNHKMEVVSGILAEECGELLSSFFRERRMAGKGSVE